MSHSRPFHLLDALHSRELSRSCIPTWLSTTLATKAIYRLKATFRQTTDTHEAQLILNELKQYALEGITEALEFYYLEKWNESNLDDQHFDRFLRPLVTHQIMELVHATQDPGLLLYSCQTINMMRCTINFGPADIEEDFRKLEIAANGTGSYAVKAAYLLTIIYAEAIISAEKKKQPGLLKHHIYRMNSIINNYLLQTYGIGVEIPNEAKAQCSIALAKLGSAPFIELLCRSYRKGKPDLAIMANAEQAQFWTEKLEHNLIFLRETYHRFYQQAIEKTIEQGLQSYHSQEIVWDIFKIIYCDALLKNEDDLDACYLRLIHEFKKKLIQAACDGNMIAAYSLIHLAQPEAIHWHLDPEDGENYHTDLTQAFKLDLQEKITWHQKIIFNKLTPALIKTKVARSLFELCQDDPEISIKLLMQAGTFGCKQSLLELGIQALSESDYHLAANYFGRLLDSEPSYYILKKMAEALIEADAATHEETLAVYMNSTIKLIESSGVWHINHMIQLVAKLDDPELAEKWRGVRREQINNRIMNTVVLQKMVDETMQKQLNKIRENKLSIRACPKLSGSITPENAVASFSLRNK